MKKSERTKIYYKYDCHCAYCGKEITEKQMQVDHIQPEVFQGTDDYYNLNPSCKECNNY